MTTSATYDMPMTNTSGTQEDQLAHTAPDPSEPTRISRARSTTSLLRHALQLGAVGLGALSLTLLSFLVLPLIQAIAQPPSADTLVRGMDTTELPPPPPPPPPEEEPEEQKESEVEPPETLEEAPPLDLAQLELALAPGTGDGWVGAALAPKIDTSTGSQGGLDDLLSDADLDSKPRAIFQQSPVMDAALRKKAPALVRVVFVVDERGRVESPLVQEASDPAFERAALAAVKQWKFEPGKRKGEPVRFRMRVPITFPRSE